MDQKEQGELGVKDLELFNMALLAKWGWHFLNESRILWVRMVNSKCRARGGGSSGRIPGGRGGGVSLWWRDLF